MPNCLFKALLLPLLVAVSMGAASAGVVSNANLELTYRDGYTPLSQSGNTFTFAPQYAQISDGTSFAIFRDGFDVAAHAGVALTGRVSYSMTAYYAFETAPPWYGDVSYGADVSVSFDVLAPYCDQCGMYDADLVGQQAGWTSVSSPTATSGFMELSTGMTAASGSYDRVLLYVVNTLGLSSAPGSLQIASFSLTFETVGVPLALASPVPELPAAWMLALGLLLIGAHASWRGRQRRFALSLSAG